MNLIHGDCLVELKKLPDKSVDMFYLDLPYGQTACEWDKKVDLKLLWIELNRLAKSERTGFFFSCTTKFGFELFNNAPKGYFRWDLVWEKNRAAGFLNAYRLPLRKHEMIYCFAKKTPDYDVSSHNDVEIKPRFTVQAKSEVYGSERGAITTTHKERLPTSVLPPQEEDIIIRENTIYQKHENEPDRYEKQAKRNGKLPTSVLLPEQDQPSSWCKYDVDGKTKHRTSKPVKLMEFLLKYWSKEGDTICDPTMGSGSMGVACANMKRNFIGIEMSEEFYQLSTERIPLY
jgi:site-specific DNA-methyltransferase (adenine-specific)